MKTDREKLIELIAECKDKYPCRGTQDYREFKEYLADYLISKGVTIPVRCGECKYWMGEILGNRCKYHSGMEHITMMPPEGFCSYGERREVED